MGRFEKGDTVWYGRGEHAKEMVIARVIDNHLLPIYQYSFEPPHDGFACGEISIREEEHGPDLKMADCYKDEEEDIDSASSIEAATRINTTAMMTRQPVRLDDFGVEGAMPGNLFFRPDIKFVEWIKDYADGRVIMDIRAGQGHLVRMLKMVGARAFGIEPYFNPEIYRKYHMSRGNVPDPNEMLAMTVEQAAGIISGMKEKVLLIFARPCHSNFVEEGMNIMDKETEALYITIPENLKLYRDMGKYHDQAVLLNHEGISEDDEVVYSVKKN